jgi:lysine/ornithine N-monooxygenase
MWCRFTLHHHAHSFCQPLNSALEQNSAGTLHICATFLYRKTGGARCKAFVANAMVAATALSHLRPRSKGAKGILGAQTVAAARQLKEMGG